jgi:hypothetical protein
MSGGGGMKEVIEFLEEARKTFHNIDARSLRAADCSFLLKGRVLVKKALDALQAPHAYKCNNEIFYQDGMTLKQYAAIKLKVPCSGDPDIDAMIRESLWKDFAAAALEGISYEYFSNNFNTGSAKFDISNIAHCARLVADAMLAEMDKKEVKK